MNSGDDLVTGDFIMTSRQLPETGAEGFSNWVLVETLSSGKAVARYHSGPEAWWEDKNTGKRFDVAQVKLWARISYGL